MVLSRVVFVKRSFRASLNVQRERDLFLDIGLMIPTREAEEYMISLGQDKEEGDFDPQYGNFGIWTTYLNDLIHSQIEYWHNKKEGSWEFCT